MADPLLPQSVLRGIGDKLYDKRKHAALEVEQIMKKLVASGNDARIGSIITKLAEDYALSPQANQRKGGLLCLAAAAVGLGDAGAAHLHSIVPPVLDSFTDQDSRVRYYACEALYNIAKVAREDFIPFFPEVFEALFKLCADSERNVQNAAQFLDNLIKDIVTASPSFDVAAFVPALQDYLTVVNPFKRQFLVSWVNVLDSVPEADLLPALPQLLGPLMAMAADPNRELRQAVLKTLQEFYVEIEATRRVDFAALTRILVDYAQSQDAGTRALALRWLAGFVGLARQEMLPLAAPVLAAVLPCIAHPATEIAQAAQEANGELLRLVGSAADGEAERLEVADLLLVIGGQLSSPADATRLAALAWAGGLLGCARRRVLAHTPLLLPPLLAALAAPSPSVASEAVRVLATVAEDEEHFQRVVEALVAQFQGPAGSRLLAHRGASVVRGLAARLGAQRVFSALAAALEREQDLRFAATLVQALNLLLLTAPEAAELRSLLQRALQSPEGGRLFAGLYRSWAHSAGATLSLCLLARAYEHAAVVVAAFADIPVTLEVLVQMDRLVGLLETPAFTFLRLHLLQPSRHPALLQAMYGLLQLLPQSDAFRTLHARLHAAPTAALLQLSPPHSGTGNGTPGKSPAETAAAKQIGFDRLLAHFVQRQEEHAREEEQRCTQSDSGPGWPPDFDGPLHASHLSDATDTAAGMADQASVAAALSRLNL